MIPKREAFQYKLDAQASESFHTQNFTRLRIELVLAQLQNEEQERLHVVLGVVNDKDLDSILPMFPKAAIYYFCKPNIPRGLDAEQLKARCSKFNLIGTVFNTVSEALEGARLQSNPNDLIFVGGSTFVVAEVV